MIKLITIGIYYIVLYIINILFAVYLIRLEDNYCKCVKKEKLHNFIKLCVFCTIFIPIIYIILLGFSYIINDKVLFNSLKIVYQILMIILMGIISFMMFIYIQIINKSECECLTTGKTKSAHKTVNILTILLLICYIIYLIIFIYLKYFDKPKDILINNTRNNNTGNNNTGNNNTGNNNTGNNNTGNNKRNTNTRNTNTRNTNIRNTNIRNTNIRNTNIRNTNTRNTNIRNTNTRNNN
jgi:amino acid transporter